jgi:hypothetical protein
LLSKNIKINIYRTVILPIVLYGFEKQSLTLRVKLRLRVFENRVLRRKFEPKWNRRKIHNEELYDLYSSPNIVRIIKSIRMRCAENVALCGRGEVHTGFLVGRPDVK